MLPKSTHLQIFIPSAWIRFWKRQIVKYASEEHTLATRTRVQNCSFLCIFRLTAIVVQTQKKRKIDELVCLQPRGDEEEVREIAEHPSSAGWASNRVEKLFLHQQKWPAKICRMRFKSASSAYLRHRECHLPSKWTRSRWRTRLRSLERIAGKRLREDLPRFTSIPEAEEDVFPERTEGNSPRFEGNKDCRRGISTPRCFHSADPSQMKPKTKRACCVLESRMTKVLFIRPAIRPELRHEQRRRRIAMVRLKDQHSSPENIWPKNLERDEHQRDFCGSMRSAWRCNKFA